MNKNFQTIVYFFCVLLILILIEKIRREKWNIAAFFHKKLKSKNSVIWSVGIVTTLFSGIQFLFLYWCCDQTYSRAEILSFIQNVLMVGTMTIMLDKFFAKCVTDFLANKMFSNEWLYEVWKNLK